MVNQFHKPVLVKEVIEYLDPQAGDVVVDGTFGFGGHSGEILKKIGRNGKIIGIEQDQAILSESAKGLDKRIMLVNDNFVNLKSILTKRKIKKVNRILLDLGISSYHYDVLGVGFSFKDQSLDMRLDRNSGETAADIVNYTKEDTLADLIYKYSDEYHSRRIAKAIVEYRRHKKFETAAELDKVINKAVYKRGKINPSTKTFQALRIAVNHELDNLQSVIPQAVDILEENGRLAIISFHSLEDRVIKNEFKKIAAEGKVKILTKKPISAQYSEIKDNARSRSAKLRVVERVAL